LESADVVAGGGGGRLGLWSVELVDVEPVVVRRRFVGGLEKEWDGEVELIVVGSDFRLLRVLGFVVVVLVVVAVADKGGWVGGKLGAASFPSVSFRLLRGDFKTASASISPSAGSVS
jgi:hypothetical protein